jgi:putative membrane protein
MGRREWLEPSAQKNVESAIASVESKTAAEIVVTVRHDSGCYRAADLLVGAVAGFGALLFYVYYPTTFTDDLVPPAILLLWLVTTFMCAQTSELKRWLTRQSELEENVRRAALSEFHEQRISVTRDRTGILVYVSLLEKVVEVVPDIGVDAQRLGEDGARALMKIRQAVKTGGVPALIDGLEQLGESLERTLPRAADDVNELPDRVVA